MKMKIKNETVFLRIVLVIIALFVLLLAVFAFPEMWRSFDFEDQNLARPMRGIIIGMYVSIIPFLTGLFQSWRLLNYVDKGLALSDSSIKALNRIKYCAIAIAVIMTSVLPLFYGFANIDDAPGVVLIGMMFVGGPIVVAVFSSLLQKIVQKTLNK